MNINMQEVATSAAFMAMGYASFNTQKTPTGHGWGQLETVSYLAEQAHRLESLYALLDDDLKDSSPGVWAYEVAEPFGLWFAERTEESGCPDQKEIDSALASIVADFFTQCDGEERGQNKACLESVLKAILGTLK